METKSRYQVIADLEEKKNGLIRERDGVKDTEKEMEMKITTIERATEDIEVQKSDFNLKQDNAKQDLKREKIDFDFKIKNTESVYKRQLEDAKSNLTHFKSLSVEKEKTLNELIKGVDDSLDRFKDLQIKK